MSARNARRCDVFQSPSDDQPCGGWEDPARGQLLYVVGPGGPNPAEVLVCNEWGIKGRAVRSELTPDLHRGHVTEETLCHILSFPTAVPVRRS